MHTALAPLHAHCQGLGLRVCPLYRTGRQGRPELIGTGTLFGGKSAAYIVTATHVIKEVAAEPLLIGGSSGLLAVPLLQTSYCYEPDSTPDIDVTVLRLPQGATLELARHYQCNFLEDTAEVAEVSVDRGQDTHVWYAIVGYPHSKNRPSYESGGEISISGHYFLCGTLTSLPRELGGGKSPEVHFTLAAPANQLLSLDLRVIAMHKTAGMSGSGVWRIEIDRSSGVISSALIGIAIEHLRKQSLLLATRIRFAAQAIATSEAHIAVLRKDLLAHSSSLR